MMKPHFEASDEGLDSIKETKYCINKSKEYIEKEKKAQFLNKLCFTYTLGKINKEKQTQSTFRMYGNIIPFAANQYPRLSLASGRYTAHFYSSPRIRQNRRSFIENKSKPSPEHKEEIKRYSQLLSKTKQNQGGLDSFWMFKKGVQSEEKKVRDKISAAKEKSEAEAQSSKVKQAFSRIFIWGKLPVDIDSGLISKILLKNYLTSLIGDDFSQWFLNFFQIRSYLNFKEFEKLGEKFTTMNIRECHLVSFMLYDRNGDGFICPRDVFSIFQKQLDPSIEKDIIAIGHFAKQNEGREEEVNQKFKMEHVVIQDELLTMKDYEVCFKKVEEPFLKATNKKDTGFSKTFAVLQHRQKIRSTRRELNQKKMMYNQLFQQFSKDTKHNAFVQLQDYRLNYTFFFQIFKENPTKLFLFFCSKILGVKYKNEVK